MDLGFNVERVIGGNEAKCCVSISDVNSSLLNISKSSISRSRGSTLESDEAIGDMIEI